MPKHPCAETSVCRNIRVPKHPCAETSVCRNIRVPKHPCAETSVCRNIRVPKHPCAETSVCRNCFWPKHPGPVSPVLPPREWWVLCCTRLPFPSGCPERLRDLRRGLRTTWPVEGETNLIFDKQCAVYVLLKGQKKATASCHTPNIVYTK